VGGLATNRPQLTSAPSIIAHNQPFTAQVQLAAGTTLKHPRVLRLMSTTTSSAPQTATSSSPG
jgi:hypothetical protein